MKYLMVLVLSVFLVSCAHKDHSSCHDSAKMECGCDKPTADKKHDCPDCDGKKSHTQEHSKMEMPAATMSEKVTQKISQEEFAQLYAKNKEKLGKSCTNPAMAYCGKTTKDMMVSENEASCLWTKVFRATRESLPELDGSTCAKMIKGFAKK
ncbi:hypothetical protein K2X05_08985 [bacterium]|nr:hypothetical protein [bacterium]